MPNWCYAEMQVKGTKENKRKLVELFLSHNDIENRFKDRYFARTWFNGTTSNLEEELEKEVSSFSLEVAWSIYSCMINGYPQEYECCPTIFEITKELELEVQIASEEQGCCFREFYHIKNGELIKNECEDFPENEYDEEKLYREYLEEWLTNHKEGIPSSYDEWLDCEYQELRDKWYWEVYDKLTLA